jgi:hypothetical protein
VGYREAEICGVEGSGEQQWSIDDNSGIRRNWRTTLGKRDVEDYRGNWKTTVR